VGTATIAHLTVTDDATFAGNITVNGHIIGNSDTRGTVTVPAGQTQFKYTFTKPYSTGSQPNVILTPKNAFAPSYRVDSTDTDFPFYSKTPAASTTIMIYKFKKKPYCRKSVPISEMKAFILYHPKSEHGRLREDYASRFEARRGLEVFLQTLKTRDGPATASI